MPKKPDGMLRIYCLCGQRMRVSEAMYGKPGKCVACRQKIRIPTEAEIPPDKIIHLKDHAEFLRKKPEQDESEPAVEMSPPADFDFEIPSTIALDVLEPLQTLTSLALKFHRKLNALDDAPHTEARRAALVAAQKRVEVARATLNEKLSERLSDTMDTLSAINTKIAQRSDLTKDGDVTMFEYRDTIDMLRRQREQLERLQHNLRGWIAARNPDMAGGFINIPSKTIPDASLPQRLPGTQEDRRPLVAQHVGALRDALARRERAERKLREEEKNTPATPPPDDTLSEQEVAKHRAEAEISFRRARLNQLAEDCSTDLQIVQTCLERERLHFNSGMIKKGGFKAVESALLEVKRDTEETHRTISRALIAAVSGDVPQIEPELLKRLSHQPLTGMLFKEPDTWVAWGSALAWWVAIFLPISQNASLFRLFLNSLEGGRPVFYSAVLPLLIGMIILVVAFLPRALWRGIGFSGLWALFSLGGLWLLHISLNAPTMEAFNRGGSWYFRPAIDMMMLADIGLFVAALWALLSARKAWGTLVGAGVLVLIGGILFAASDPKHPVSPSPSLATRISTATPASPVLQAPSEPQSNAIITPETPEDAVESPAPKVASPDAGVIVQLRGIGAGKSQTSMQFMLSVDSPDMGKQNLNIEIGETVFGKWKASEFNSKRHTLTISNGERVLILQVGTPQPLDLESPEITSR